MKPKYNKMAGGQKGTAYIDRQVRRWLNDFSVGSLKIWLKSG